MHYLSSLLLSPFALSALALAILCIGLPFARRFRRPRRYIIGIVLIALSLLSFWPLQGIIFAAVEQWEARWMLQILAVVFSVSLLGGGLGAVSKANNSARDDFYDNLFS